eukprot:8609669-Pyramimonas_sp.AAC.1
MGSRGASRLCLLRSSPLRWRTAATNGRTSRLASNSSSPHRKSPCRAYPARPIARLPLHGPNSAATW